MLVEKQKKINFEVTGDFHEESELREMNVPEFLTCTWTLRLNTTEARLTC